MKTFTKYIAYDGTEFDNEEKCLDYEKSMDRILRDKIKKMKYKIINVQEELDELASEVVNYLVIKVETFEQADTVYSFLIANGVDMKCRNFLLKGHVVFIDGAYDDYSANGQGDELDNYVIYDYIGTEEEMISFYTSAINNICKLPFKGEK